MIDVKELRIGNYVFPKNDSGKETVIGEIFAINNYLIIFLIILKIYT